LQLQPSLALVATPDINGAKWQVASLALVATPDINGAKWQNLRLARRLPRPRPCAGPACGGARVWHSSIFSQLLKVTDHGSTI